jgi:serine/threonine-protein kinase
MLAPGAVVGKYRVEGARGQGGMGVVYEATQLNLDRRLALKVLREDLATDPVFAERFRREGRIQASLDHQHIVPVYEAGESEHGLYLAMQLVPGATLAELLREGGLDAGRAIRLLGQVASALDAAHAAGLVHRDVKPQNVLVDEGDRAYLADFGITKMGEGTAVTGSGAVTSTGPMLGTVAYLAPEVIRGEPATPASDRYAFAAMLFECLAGSVVFPRSSDVAVLYAHTSEPPPRISVRRSELPVELDGVLTKALAKDPRARQATATAIVEEAKAALGAEAIATLGPPPAAVEVDSSRPLLEKRSRRRLSVLPTALGVVLAAFIAFFVGGRVLGPSGEKAPPVPKGAIALGSDLSEPGETMECNGRRRSAAPKLCSIVQTALPGRRLVAPSDGAIFSWAVRGAKGEVRLQVLRDRDGPFQVAASQYEMVPDEGPHLFKTNLFIFAGDLVALEVGDEGAMGVRRIAGARTRRWIPPRRGFGGRDQPFLSDLDVEVLLRVDFFPGAKQRAPTELVGKDAAAAPEGTERGRTSLKFNDGRVVELAVVELDDRVVLDLYRKKKRVARIDVPDLKPGGDLRYFEAIREGDEPAVGECAVGWVNPGSARFIKHDYGILPLEFDWFT